MALRRKTWNGDEIKARMERANGRAVVAMAEHTVSEMKKATHVDSGDLRRSEHAAKRHTMGEIDAHPKNVRTGKTEWQVEVGSWLPYACVENSRGGEHRFADIGFQLAEPTFEPTLIAAYRAERL